MADANHFKRKRTLRDFTVGIGWIRDVAFARRGWLPALLVVFGAAAISLVLTGRQIWLADWGIVDDHEIFYFLGNKLHLPFSEIVNTVLDKTEVGSLQGRFRPSYYLLRVVESWAWGRDVHLWYAFGTATFAFFLGAVWWVLARFLGLLPSALCMVPVAFAKFWGAIWGRLGPAEIYAVPATGLMLLGCYELFFAPSAPRRNFGCAALTIGTVIVIGTKETLLPLALLALFYVALAVVDRRLTVLSGLAAGAITLSSSLATAWIVSRQLAGAGADIYGNSVSPATRLTATLASMRPFGIGFISIAMIAIALVARRAWRYRKLLSTGEMAGGLGTLCFMLAFFISQELAYGGGLPTGTRYDFPAMLVPVFFVYFIACAVDLRLRETEKETSADARGLLFAAAVVFLFLAAGGLRGAAKSFDEVETNILKTRKFSAELAAIVSRARMEPSAPIILEAYGGGAYEPVYSLQRYLFSAGLKNPLAVRLHADPTSSGRLYENLEKMLRALQDSGGNSFVGLEDLPAATGCLSIGINGAADGRCSGFEVRT